MPTPTPTPTATPTATPVTHTVVVGPDGEFTFSPSSLTIHVGDTVQWTWSSSGHNVVSGSDCTADDQFCSPNDSNCAQAPLSGSGTTYSHTFTAEGTYPYFCSQHCSLGMVGTITVDARLRAAAVDPVRRSVHRQRRGRLRLRQRGARGGRALRHGATVAGHHQVRRCSCLLPLQRLLLRRPNHPRLFPSALPRHRSVGLRRSLDHAGAGIHADKITPAHYRSHFSKSTEVASPGYYSARLNNGNILAELTTTGRVGLHRYTFPEGASGAAVVIDAGHHDPRQPGRRHRADDRSRRRRPSSATTMPTAA